MRHISLLAVLTTAVLLISACSNKPIKIVTTQISQPPPELEQPIYLGLLPTYNHNERRLLTPLRQELCRQQFNMVDDPAQSRWIMVLTHNREIFRSGVDNNYHLAGSAPYRPGQTYAQLYLFPTEGYGDPQQAPVWVGRMVTEPVHYKQYEPIIFHRLLERFGNNTRGNYKLSKPYLRQVRKAPACTG